MDATDQVEAGTNHGLKLESVVALALDAVDLQNRKAWQYDEYSLTPDFSIPDTDHPRFIIEITQVEARNVFQRKVLRYIQAVADAKVHFGPHCISVNILFGDVSTLPPSSVSLLASLFDINIFPTSPGSEDFSEGLHSLSKELVSGQLASVAIGELKNRIKKRYSKEIKQFGSLIADKLSAAQGTARLKGVWEQEIERANKVGQITHSVGTISYYRDALLRSFYLPEAVYQAFAAQGHYAAEGAIANLELLKSHEIVEHRRTLLGGRLFPKPPLSSLAQQDTFAQLRGYCSSALESAAATRWHFQDIREPDRLVRMVEAVCELMRGGKTELTSALIENARTGRFAGIDHSRCWIADVIAEIMSVTHNSLNNLILRSGIYTGTIPNPFNNLTMRSERFLAAEPTGESLCRAVIHEFCRDHTLEERLEGVDTDSVVDGLFALRLYASKGLQNFNPLEIALKGIAGTHGFAAIDLRVGSFLNDLMGTRSPVGKFDILEFRRPADDCRFWLTCIAVGANYSSDHKADEWSARLRAATYRLFAEVVTPVTKPKTVFVFDGNWSDKSVTKLRRAGWDVVCDVIGFQEEVSAM